MKIHATKQTVLTILFVILGLIGGALVHYGTNWGPWTEDDSVEYFEAAQNLAAGKGLVLIRATGKISYPGLKSARTTDRSFARLMCSAENKIGNIVIVRTR